jgi:hypothetical protein
MSELDELRDWHEYVVAVSLELLQESTTRAALFRALDDMQADNIHREPLTELVRCAVVLRSLSRRIEEHTDKSGQGAP